MIIGIVAAYVLRKLDTGQSATGPVSVDPVRGCVIYGKGGHGGDPHLS
jgi:hypothetical protein